LARIERIFESLGKFEALGKKGTGKKCAARQGLIKEGDEMAGNTEETAVRDAGLIAAAQKVEHYENLGLWFRAHTCGTAGE
jgi:ferritin-like metal-binding protein YciE